MMIVLRQPWIPLVPSMKRRGDPYPDPDDMFADTRMTLGGHIEELRSHLLRRLRLFPGHDREPGHRPPGAEVHLQAR